MESPGRYEYESASNQVNLSSHFERDFNSKSKISRQDSGNKTRRRSSADAEFEEDGAWKGDSDEDAKTKGKEKGDNDGKLVVSVNSHSIRKIGIDLNVIDASR